MKGSVHKQLIEMYFIEGGLQSFHKYHFLKISKFLQYAGVILETEGKIWKKKKRDLLTIGIFEKVLLLKTHIETTMPSSIFEICNTSHCFQYFQFLLIIHNIIMK